MPDTQPTRTAIFRAGKHTSVDGRTLEFSAADIAAIAASYNPDVSEAPLVVGHPALDAPAYGWVKSLVAQGDVLYAEPAQVEPQFAGLVNAGRLKKISASIYLPDSPGNPTPGKFYLRHVGFLGATPPAVKGLPSAKFAEGDGAVEFAAPATTDTSTLAELFGRVRDWFAEREATESVPVIPAAAFAEPAHAASTPETIMPDDKQAAEFAERETALNTRQSEIETREKALADREAKARRSDAADFAEGLVKEGKLLPREKAPVVELLLALPTAAVSFAEGDATVSKPGAEVLRGLLSGLPKRVDYAEKAGADNPGNAATAANFAAPNGETVDAAQLELHRKAQAYQAEHKDVSYLAAVKAVGG